MKDLRNKAQEVIEQVNRYVLGKKPEVREVMIAILAGGRHAGSRKNYHGRCFFQKYGA